VKIKIIGAGGIGTALVSPLCRYLNFSKKTEENLILTIIDGDVYEDKNRERQLFHRIGNKADVTVEKLKEEFKEITLKSRGEYITPKSIEYLVENGDIILLCVDNHKTRNIVSTYCQDLDNVTLISGGNDYTDGNIQVHIRKDGINKTLPIANQYHLEILVPEDKSPGEIGCDQLIKSEPQLIITNFMIAALMLNAFYCYLEDKLNYDEVYADILTNNCRQVIRRQE
jgi:molybdopterin/thiamine biosynthesis adenylyltransferase